MPTPIPASAQAKDLNFDIILCDKKVRDIHVIEGYSLNY
jgi:hypothetical protein